jgi:putative SOS response-associated peptidase YedK
VCGRFVSYFDPAELVGLFNADQVTDLPGPSWNIAPTNQVAMVRAAPPGRGPDSVDSDQVGRAARGGRPGPARQGRVLGETGPDSAEPAQTETSGRGAERREIRVARWGLVPPWSKDPAIGPRLINARSETVTVKPAFRAAARSRRALIPAAGYYEWQAGGQGPKTPFFLHPGDGGPIALAALYEWWFPPRPTDGKGDDAVSRPVAGHRRQAAPRAVSGTLASGDAESRDPSRPEPLLTITVVTRAATDALGAIHDRMPLVVPPDLWDPWLHPAVNTAAAVSALIAQIPDPVLIPREVGRAVGSVRNNGPALIEPVP